MEKKIGVWIALLVLYGAVIGSMFILPSVDALDPDSYIFGAHRGSSIKYIENTMDAFKEAVNDERYEFIELDVQNTKNGKLVIYHDISLLRIQQKNYSIGELTYEELQEVSDYEIPLYEDVIDLIGSKKKLNIEFKSQGDIREDKNIVDFVVKDCAERGLNDVIFSAIDGELVKYIKETYPHLKVGKIYWVIESTYLPFDYFTEKLYDQIEDMGADYVMLHGSNLRNFTSLKNMKPDNVGLFFWYFDDQMYYMKDDTSPRPW